MDTKAFILLLLAVCVLGEDLNSSINLTNEMATLQNGETNISSLSNLGDGFGDLKNEQTPLQRLGGALSRLGNELFIQDPKAEIISEKNDGHLKNIITSLDRVATRQITVSADYDSISEKYKDLMSLVGMVSDELEMLEVLPEGLPQLE